MAKELPIGFTAENVKAVYEGRKTVTRRVINPQPEVFDNAGYPDYVCLKHRYQVGDLLWLKESYCHGIEWDDCKPSEVDPLCGGNDIWYFADGERPTEGWGKKRSSRFMPKWVARTWLEVVSVRPERVQDITDEDAIKEGIRTVQLPNKVTLYHISTWPDPMAADTPRGAFRNLWDSINAKRGYPWESNPFVWRIEFKELKHLKQGSENVGIHTPI